MSFLDFIAFFIYTGLFAFIAYKYARRIKQVHLKRYFISAFWIKIFASFCYAMFVLHISVGDAAVLFYPEGYNLFRLVLIDPGNLSIIFGPASAVTPDMLFDPTTIGYMGDPSNFMIIRITALLCFISLGKFMVINLIFSLIAFSGIWKLFMFFYEQYPAMHRQFSFSILYLPTFVFWSSGIMKETIAIAALGWFTYSLYQLVYSRKRLFSNGIIVLITVYLFSSVKEYILVAYLPAFIVFLLLKNAENVKNIFGKILLIVLFLGGSILAFISSSDKMQGVLVKYAGNDIGQGIAMHQQAYRFQEATSEGSSYFSLGVEFDGSPGSLARIAPAAIVASLYRPYLWESKKISTLMSSLESLALMLFTISVLFKTGIKNFFRTIFTKPIVLYSLLFSLIFALFVGATTLNFGTLVRYKIPAMPFYVVSMFFILYFNKKPKTDATKTAVIINQSAT